MSSPHLLNVRGPRTVPRGPVSCSTPSPCSLHPWLCCSVPYLDLWCRVLTSGQNSSRAVPLLQGPFLGCVPFPPPPTQKVNELWPLWPPALQTSPPAPQLSSYSHSSTSSPRGKGQAAKQATALNHLGQSLLAGPQLCGVQTQKCSTSRCSREGDPAVAPCSRCLWDWPEAAPAPPPSPETVAPEALCFHNSERALGEQPPASQTAETSAKFPFLISCQTSKVKMRKPPAHRPWEPS